MSVNYGEPPSKRSRGEMGSGKRTITLNMGNYDESVQYYSDDELVKIFDLGLRIRESAILSIDVNPNIVGDAINIEMQPVHVSLARMEEQTKNGIQQVKEEVSGELERGFEAFGSKLTTSVETVAKKVQPLDLLNRSIESSSEGIKTQLQKDIQGSESRLEKRLDECKGKLDSISKSLEKPSSKGSRGKKKFQKSSQFFQKKLQSIKLCKFVLTNNSRLANYVRKQNTATLKCSRVSSLRKDV